MLIKNILFLGLAALSAASPLLDTRATTKAVTGAKTSTKGKSTSATCPATQLTAGVTCPRAKFTTAQITRAVKQAKAMKVKGKTGKGLHFPAKYVPTKEAKIKGKAKASKSTKVVRREEGHIIEARRARGGSTRTRTKPATTRKTKTKTKTTPKKGKSTTGKKTTKTTKTKKDKCKAGAAPKVGKGVWMFPILEKGVWKPGAMPEVNYVILDSKFNYVKTAEREPGSAEEYEVCIENPQKKTTATKGKATKTKGAAAV